MCYALDIAARARGSCKPNPIVGAVVARDGRIIGEGTTQPAGSAHAEIVALEQAGEEARGASLYVTLEPCSHHGRTAPCVDAVLKAGIAEVHVAMIDPSPWVAGEGVARLRAAGVPVVVGEHGDEARSLNLPYFVWVEQDRPYVTAVYAREPSGRSTPVDWSEAVRSPASEFGRLRLEADVIVVDQAWQQTGVAAEQLSMALPTDNSGVISIDAWRDVLRALAERGTQHIALDAPPATIESFRQAGLADHVLVVTPDDASASAPSDPSARRLNRLSSSQGADSAPTDGQLACSRGS